MAAGLGGQRLFLFPGLKLLVVTTAGNYEKSMPSAPPRDVLGTVLGCLLLGIVNVGLTMLKVSEFWQIALYGAAIIVAASLDSALRTKRTGGAA